MTINHNRTQEAQVLSHLRGRMTITPLESNHLYGIYRLSSVIHRMRKRGYHITTSMKVAPNGAKYGEYRLHRPEFEKQTVRVPVNHTDIHAAA